MNYLNYIVKSKIVKRNNIQINIPTFNDYETTKNTIKTLFNQKDIKFDILLIDNGTKDYVKLIKYFPKINYILLKENTGSSGAQRIGAEIALKYDYQYIIFTDNDALLLDNYGLLKMKNKLDSNTKIVAVIPQHTESFDNTLKKDFYVNSWSFHYLFVKTIVFKKIDLHAFSLFLYSDDLSLTLKIRSINKILVCSNVKYYHYRFHPKSLQNFYNYYYLRGTLYIIFKEKHILFKSRINCLINFIYKMLQMFVHSLIFFDFSYIKTIILSFRGFINFNKNYLQIILSLPNKYILEEYSPERIKNPEKSGFINLLDNYLCLLIPNKKLYLHSNYLNKNIYYRLKKNG